jgi:very-short-patch-repair endonuclease
MTRSTAQSLSAWGLARRQHGVVARRQLLALGFSPEAIDHRLRTGRLHALHRGVFAVGRSEVDGHGRWMAAVLSCGDGALLSHSSAAALWKIGKEGGRIAVSVPVPRTVRRPGIRVHRRSRIEAADRMARDGIPVTSPVRTLLDLAVLLEPTHLEAALNEADKLDLVDAGSLKQRLERHSGEPGVGALRNALGADFVLTDSDLERKFLPIARRAGLPKPRTQVQVNGYRVDFFWPELGLVVETDGLRYHRTAAQQARDRVRDQAHAEAGMTSIRFTYRQVTREPDRVERTLRTIAARLLLC